MEKNEIQIARHSLSHVLAHAVKNLYPDVKIAIGPAIDNGFYYDFDNLDNFSEADFKTVEKEMQKIINSNLSFERRELSRADALKLFKTEPYKVELINDLPKDAVISTYTLGGFTDLCAGPHVEKAGKLANWGYKIARFSGAYWRGSEKNKMLKRIYVYAFPTKKELFEYEQLQAEALKRDHRKLGKDLGLFFFSEYAQGVPFFEPKGLILKNELIKFWREKHIEAGYAEIESPIVLNRKLWEVSGHWDNYKDNMYSFKIEDETFAIKPMNCPGGILYYQEKLHSYKDFPLRVGELGKVHRHESSGTLHGLFRVRSFTQDDAHIFMLDSQIADEIKNILDLVDIIYGVFGLSYHLELSTMPEKHIGEKADWDKAEDALKAALNKIGKEFIINEGDGAFYGPKIDIHIKDAIGRTWQCGTIQLDMQLPKRFNIEYIDANGEKHEPVMIHRVIYGSIERFLGIITEHYAGAFPVWLAPVQVKVMNISEKCSKYANKIYISLKNAGIRAELDDRNETIGYKIREASAQKIPYMIVLGDKEQASKTLTVRMRGNKELTGISLAEFIKRISSEINTRLDK